MRYDGVAMNQRGDKVVVCHLQECFTAAGSYLAQSPKRLPSQAPEEGVCLRKVCPRWSVQSEMSPPAASSSPTFSMLKTSLAAFFWISHSQKPGQKSKP